MYGFNVKLDDSFQNSVDRVTKELQKEGFGILTQIDVQATLKQKLGIEHKPYLILGACNPQLAHRALEIDPEIGLLLPCNVVVREADNGGTLISFMDPIAVLTMVNKPEIAEIAHEVRGKLDRVCAALSTKR